MFRGAADRVILLYTRKGEPVPVRYRDLHIQLGWDHRPSLVEALEEEGDKIRQFVEHRNQHAKPLMRLNKEMREAATGQVLRMQKARHRCAEALAGAKPAKRQELLSSYYVLSRFHGKVLDEVTAYLLAGSESDHSPNEVSLMRFALNDLLFSMRNEERKSGGPTAFHSVEAARGAAKNGQRIETILATLLHDLLEDKLDEWSSDQIHRCIDTQEAYEGLRGRKLKQLPVEVRTEILRQHIDEYNNQAAGIYYGLGLRLYEHVRFYRAPERYCQMLNSVMEMLARLSRTRDTSYYHYLQDVLYPKPRPPHTILRPTLLRVLRDKVPEPHTLLDDFLREVDGFYATPMGEFHSKDEVVRNSLREVLAKILDRLNNTRDMAREDGFSVAKRLYGAGYKNIYFLQAVEDRLRLPGLTSEERRLIEVKFINKPKVAALYQIWADLHYLEQIIGSSEMARLRDELEAYKRRADFRRITASSDQGSAYDGIILMFNEAILGNKHALDELESDPHLEARVALAFQAVLEYFLAYPALIQEEMRSRKLKDPSQTSFDKYRIVGMSAQMERQARGGSPAVLDLAIKSFRRTVLPDPLDISQAF